MILLNYHIKNTKYADFSRTTAKFHLSFEQIILKKENYILMSQSFEFAHNEHIRFILPKIKLSVELNHFDHLLNKSIPRLNACALSNLFIRVLLRNERINLNQY